MKLLKKFALLGLVAPLLFSLLSFTNTVSESVVTIRVFECVSGCKPRIIISDKEKSKVINLEKDKNYASLELNIDVVSNTLEQYHKEGFKVETSNTAILPGPTLLTTYILTK